MTFKEEFTFEQRELESTKILSKYQDKVPIIVEKANKNTIEISKKKFLVPHDLSMSQFIYVIRKKINISPEKGIFLFINGKIPASSQLMTNLYNENKDKDGFLYITYSEENTFG